MRIRTFHLVLIGLGILAALSSSGQQGQEDHSLYWHQRADHFRSLPDRSGEIIFLGDSITDGCNWSEMLDNPKVINRGISGDTTTGLLDRLDEVVSSKPVKIFLLIGINDLASGRTESFILAKIKSIIKEIRQKSPETSLFVQSVLPVNDRYPFFPNHVDKTPQILTINTVLRRMAGDYDFRYVDLFSALADKDNRLKDDYTNDGLHLTGAGYAAWKSAIERFVRDARLPALSVFDPLSVYHSL